MKGSKMTEREEQTEIDRLLLYLDNHDVPADVASRALADRRRELER